MASKRNSKLKNFIFFILLFVLVVNVGLTIFSLRDKYFSSNYWQNFSSLEKVFLSSQYVNKNPEGWIPDETAFSYAGGMLINGTNPVLVVPDAPPLGKYLIGLSAVIFNNDSEFVLLSALIALFLMYLLGMQIFYDKTIAIIPPLLFSFEPIFKNQLEYTPLMDLFQLVFLLASFYFFNKAFLSKRTIIYYLLANLFLGFFIATKFFITGIVIVAAWYLVLVLRKDWRRILKLCISLPLSIVVLLVSYSWVFAFGYTFAKFLGIQKWVYLYHQSFLILPGSVWPLLMLNKWYVWFGDKPVISDSQWLFTWPILTIISFVVIVIYFFKIISLNKNIEVLFSWALVYLIFLSFGQTFSRYLLILIPILYIISIYGILEFYKSIKSFKS